ncbi:MAG TPA: hypothetical protein VFL91_10930 [Thermomicrobiales bacterium]|nr:hypothetical protein [Thermomicrobiales bacterium]
MPHQSEKAEPQSQGDHAAPAQAAGPALDPRDPDIARVESAYGLVSQEGMTPELATQILSLADSTPAQVTAAIEALAAKTAAVRADADARLADERAVHEDITAKLDAATKEEAADYTAQRDEQDRLLTAARGLGEQVGRVVAFFGLPAPGAVAQAQAAPAEPTHEEGAFGRLLGLFVERRDDEERRAPPPAEAPAGAVKGDEPPIYDPQDDAVRKVGVLASLIALPNRTAEQVLAMVKPQGIDLAAIGRIVGDAHAIAARQIAQSEAIKALVEARHQEEVGRFGAAASKENTQYAAVVKEHDAAVAQVADLEAKMARLREFFGFPAGQVPRQRLG